MCWPLHYRPGSGLALAAWDHGCWDQLPVALELHQSL